LSGVSASFRFLFFSVHKLTNRDTSWLISKRKQKEPEFPPPDAIQKLEAHVEALLTLTMRATARFFFLRPMLTDQVLHDRINGERTVAAFEGLRNWLYWGLVLELSKICSDDDNRSPSIIRVTEKLKNVHLRKQLEDKWVKQNREPGEDEEPLRVQFNREYSDYLCLANKTLSTHSVGGYKDIRDKLIAHNELRWSGSRYDFYDVKDAGLTIGDERRLLETLQELAHQLLRIVRGVDFTWETALHNDKKRARDFWGLADQCGN
jgi:hypothetical protein